ncbi:MAG: hypothetical protein WCT49_01495 [Candidatus Paceibacterota bacterium]|jgi:cytoskeletal protein RodZ|nr:hypothetical protein [Candidatus Paceibacterota bacterium]
MENENIEPTTAENMPPMQTPPQVAPRSSGALIGTIIVVIILVLGGLYIWNSNIQPKIEQKLTPPTEEQQAAQETAAANASIEQLGAQSPSDETASIESDLNVTNLDNIDADIQAI